MRDKFAFYNLHCKINFKLINNFKCLKKNMQMQFQSLKYLVYLINKIVLHTFEWIYYVQ